MGQIAHGPLSLPSLLLLVLVLLPICLFDRETDHTCLFFFASFACQLEPIKHGPVGAATATVADDDDARRAPLMNESFQFWNFLNEFVKTRRRRKRRKREREGNQQQQQQLPQTQCVTQVYAKLMKAKPRQVCCPSLLLPPHSLSLGSSLSVWLRPCLTESCLWRPAICIGLIAYDWIINTRRGNKLLPCIV